MSGIPPGLFTVIFLGVLGMVSPINKVDFQAISPADFFYRNRDIAGFDNPTRALYTAFRELVENSLDACEDGGFLPDIQVSVSPGDRETFWKLKVIDNGLGVPQEHIALAFGQILYGSKYMHRQSRGRFGLGGKMAYLYGQITTHKPLTIVSAIVGSRKKCQVVLHLDIKENTPKVHSFDEFPNEEEWHGTSVEFSLLGDWIRSKKAILEYVEQTALITPYANITFIDPKGTVYYYPRTVDKLPPLPREVLPHPYGIDVEQLRRVIEISKSKNMIDFLTMHFHRVGKTIASKFLNSTKIASDRNPKSLEGQELVELVENMKKFKGFLPPDAKFLSPLGEELLRIGITNMLKPKFVEVIQRPPSSYEGHPFIVEVGIAFGGSVPLKTGITLFRFANRIPLIFDEYKDVTSKVVRSVDWGKYKIRTDMPIAVFMDIVSTKIPFKTAGKEFIADREEVEREVRLAVQSCARSMRHHLTRQERIQREHQRIKLFEKYLPLIARDVGEMTDKSMPDVKPLLNEAGRILRTIKRKESKALKIKEQRLKKLEAQRKARETRQLERMKHERILLQHTNEIKKSLSGNWRQISYYIGKSDGLTEDQAKRILNVLVKRKIASCKTLDKKRVWRSYKTSKSKGPSKTKTKGKTRSQKGKKPVKRLSQELVLNVVGTRWGSVNTIKAKLPGFKKSQVQRHLNKLKKEGKVLSHSINKVRKWKLNSAKQQHPEQVPDVGSKEQVPKGSKTRAPRKKKSKRSK
ncbi:MAG: DNA topoisomerase VI subunit B [Candidatus Ranarchaeia archaeon]